MTREKFIEGLSIMEKYQISGILYDTITRYEEIVESLKDERANMTKTHAINILHLRATIEAQEIIIKDKSAYMDAMAQPKTCYDCEFSTFFPYDENEGRWKTCTCAWSPALDNRVTPSQWCYAYSKEAQ